MRNCIHLKTLKINHNYFLNAFFDLGNYMKRKEEVRKTTKEEGPLWKFKPIAASLVFSSPVVWNGKRKSGRKHRTNHGNASILKDNRIDYDRKLKIHVNTTQHILMIHHAH